MMNEADQIIDEIREGRKHLSLESGHDVARLVEHLKSLNSRYQSQVDLHRLVMQQRGIESTPRPPQYHVIPGAF